MRSPTEVLKHLSEKSQDKTYRFQRLYRNLYNPEFYYTAYRNIYANGGSMTPGVDGTTIDGLGGRRIGKIIESLKDESYQPHPARREYIEKKNSTKKRPLGIPSGDDKLVQEIVRMLLESIYDSTFSNRSHGFRQHRGCHTALKQIQDTFTGATWFVEGDITACFDSFDHHVLIDLLRKRIDDEKFIALMWKFLKAGYMEQWQFHSTYSGVPQGSGISPILANVYLNQLDEYMEEYKAKIKTGDSQKRKLNRSYTRLGEQISLLKKVNRKVWNQLSKEEKAQRAKMVHKLQTDMLRLPTYPYRDTTYKNLQYVRFADDFIIGLCGSKADAEKLKADLTMFLEEKLKLKLSDAKTKITHTTQKAQFLGYDITVSHSQDIRRTKKGYRRRIYKGRVMLLVPHEKWASKLLEYKAIRIKRDEKGKDHWRAIHRSGLINLTDIDILNKYNSEVRGLYNYYCIANNASVIGKFAGLMKHSMLKTFAGKYRTKVNKIKARYVKNGTFTVQYTTKRGLTDATFPRSFVKQSKPTVPNVDVLPAYKRYERKDSLAARIKAGVCELCGKAGCEIEMHQVRRLKDLRGRNQWELVMLDIRRKTLAVCHDCHDKIHACD